MPGTKAPEHKISWIRLESTEQISGYTKWKRNLGLKIRRLNPQVKSANLTREEKAKRQGGYYISLSENKNGSWVPVIEGLIEWVSRVLERAAGNEVTLKMIPVRHAWTNNYL